MIQKHTIIIQTKNRSNWLNYSLNLYSQYKCKSKIVIIDGSDDEIYSKNSLLISSLKEKLSIEQIRETTSFSEAHRNKNLSFFNYLKNFLNTPYFTHIPDDDMFFPIYSGEHEGEWNSCTDCHTESNYSTFSCIECHEHNDQNDLTQEHRDVDDFVYESSDCFACHPTGEE